MRNQLASHFLGVRKAALLCMPTAKNGVATDLGADRFRCDKAKGTQPGSTVTLADQFETKQTVVGSPALFCNPAQQTLAMVQQPARRLVCYQIKTAPAASGRVSAFTASPSRSVRTGAWKQIVRSLLDCGRMATMSEREEAAERLRLAFDLFAAGEAMMRQNLRRRFPGASDAEIEDHLLAWLAERPGAEHGDAAGRPGEWPRTRR